MTTLPLLVVALVAGLIAAWAVWLARRRVIRPQAAAAVLLVLAGLVLAFVGAR